MGSRYGGLKQLEPVGPSGEKLMDYSLFDARRAGVERVVFVIRKEFEQFFHEQVGARFAQWMDVGYAFQEIDLLPKGNIPPMGRTKPWGTGHAVLAAKNVIKNPFIVINADDFYGRGAFSAIADWISKPTSPGPEQYAMVAYQLANTLSQNGKVARGVCQVGGNGLLGEIEEHTALEFYDGGIRNTQPDGSTIEFGGDEPVSMNLWGFRPSLFAHLESLFGNFMKEHGSGLKSEFYLPVAIDAMMRDGRATVQVLTTPGRWFGITYPEDKGFVALRVHELVASGEYPSSLWS
jgi:NDP-sugar pyrophosphorylase family protein